MYYPSYEQMKAYEIGDCHLIPLKKEIYSDLFTPIIMLKKLKSFSSHCFILESHEDAKNWGRYSFLGFHPKAEFTCKNNRMKYRGKYRECYDPARYLRQILKQYKSVDVPGFPPLTGGLVGYFAYDYLRYGEDLTLHGEDDEKFKDVDVMIFDEIICIDHYRQKISIIVNVDAHDIDTDYPRKCHRLDEIETILKMDTMEVSDPLRIKSDFQMLYSRREYRDMADKALKQIKAGEIARVVLSNRLAAHCAGSLLDTYRIMRVRTPSPYMFYFSSSSLEVAGASLETLVKLKDDQVYAFPVTGSRPRGMSYEEDQAREQELLADEKAWQEHDMLVELGCRDLNRVAQPGSVQIISHHEVLKYSKMMHLATEISGTIAADKDALDAIAALLPSWSWSGIPKIEACRLIDTLEHHKRGIYGGAIGYLDFKGNMDTSTAFYLAYKKKDHVYIRSGEGIVSDSEPDEAYDACLRKAKEVIDALRMAQGGID